MNIEENLNENLQCENCIICLDNNETVNNNIIEYNHCGKYSVHEKCNDKWLMKHKSCFICRINFEDENIQQINQNENQNANQNENFININTIPESDSGICNWRVLTCALRTAGTITLVFICLATVVVLL